MALIRKPEEAATEPEIAGMEAQPTSLDYWTPRARRWKLPASMEPVAIFVLFAVALLAGPALCRALIALVRHFG